ncbi:MAG: hypothetical protein LDLANPLL_01916 [Turneriella sp.]|nr:hypothetical protein [Turneriella sp.]
MHGRGQLMAYMIKKSTYKKFCFQIFSLVFFAIVAASCSNTVYHYSGGELTRGTFYFLRDVYYQDQFEDEETPQARNKAILEDLADLDGIGSLATKKGLKKDPSYADYMFRQKQARYGKAAIVHWQKKYKEKFNWEMLFAAEGLKYDQKQFAQAFGDLVNRGKEVDALEVAEYEGKKIIFSDLKMLMPPLDYDQVRHLRGQGILSAMKDALKAYLEKKIYDKMVKQYFADEKQLLRYDHDRVGVLYLKVLYGKAGKGIYPASMEKIPLQPKEVYDHFFKMQNTLADVLWVKAAYTVVAEDSYADEILEKLKRGEDFEKLAARYAIAPKFAQTARPHRIKGYNPKRGVDEREARNYYDRLILDMASRDIKEPEPYLGRDGIVIVRFYDIKRALEKVKLTDVAWKVENDLRTQMLNAVYEPDIKDARAKLKIVFNDRLVKKLN